MKRQNFSLNRKELYFIAIFELNDSKNYSIEKLCQIAKVSRSGYYKWKKREKPVVEIETEKLAVHIKRIFEESDRTFGVIRIQCALKRELNLQVNVKKVRRLMRILDLYPEIRKKRPNWKKVTTLHTCDNVINRNFNAEKPNQKWFTDISYLFYGNHQKAYISAIIDRFDMSIVSYIVGKCNDNQLVIDTVIKAMSDNIEARPIIHSDRGFQYTSNAYHQLKEAYGFTVSMSRAGKCLDNQPIESFWGTLKSEYYYRKEFDTFEELKVGIDNYIGFYHHRRYVPKFEGLTPIEY
ncbi:TPA: IS3 family transposase, partial [Enterococcus faecalis]|nr:IS3 family transposase [Enterococcus faecalis]